MATQDLQEAQTQPLQIGARSKKSPPNRKYSEQIIPSLTEMDLPPLVKSVLREHDAGQFNSSSFLWENMRRDDRIQSVLNTRVNALLALDHTFISSKLVSKAAGDDGAERADEVWYKFASRADKQQILRWALGLGVAFGRISWSISPYGWLPKVEVWHPCFLNWRDDINGYVVFTKDQGEQLVTPGANGWWLYTPYGFKRGWIDGLVRCLALPWLARQWTYRDWARYSEVHGLPTIKAKIPLGAQEDDEIRFVTELANRSSEPLVRLPQDVNGVSYDFELVEAKADTWKAFQGLKAEANVDIAVAILGQNLSTEVQGGSFAAAKVQERVRDDILDFDARSMEEFLEAQILRPWAFYNLPGGADAAPCPVFDTEEPEDVAALGDGYFKLGNGLTALRNSGVSVDVDEVMEDARVPTTAPFVAPPVVATPLPPVDGKTATTDQLPTLGKQAKRQLVSSEGAMPSADNTQLEGQAYADAIVASQTREATRHMSSDRLRILAVVNQATSYEHMKELLEKAYSDMSPEELSNVVKAALLEAELNGLYSARGL